MILTVTLNPALDLILGVDHFESGQDHRIKKTLRLAGGKGVNVSRWLTQAGVLNQATGFVGGPSGRQLERELKLTGVQARFVRISSETRLNLTVVDERTKQVSRFLGPEPSVSFGEWKKFLRLYGQLLKNCRYAVFSGRKILGLPVSVYFELIQRAKKKGILTFLDSSGPALKAGFKAKPYLIKPNQEEIQVILGYVPRTLKEWKEALQSLVRDGISVALITRGAQGAVATNGSEYILIKPPVISLVSPPGCGDAFLAGFLAGVSRGRNFADSVKSAASYGTAQAFSVFSRTPSLKAAGEFYGKIKLISL